MNVQGDFCMNERLKDIEEGYEEEGTVNSYDIEWLIERTKQAERYEEVLQKIVKLPDDELSVAVVHMVMKVLSDK